MSIYLEGNPSSRQVVAEPKAVGTVITKDTILAFDGTTGLMIPAVAATTRRAVAGLATQSIAAGISTSVDVEKIIADAEYSVSTTNNSDVTHNGQAMILTNAGEVNNTGTTSAVGIVVQTGVLGVASDKKIKVRFVTSV